MQDWPKDLQGRLSKVFTFKNYRQCFAFVSQVVLLAEKKNHHPEILLKYNRVTITIFSHDENKITSRDYEMVRLIDKIINND